MLVLLLYILYKALTFSALCDKLRTSFTGAGLRDHARVRRSLTSQIITVHVYALILLLEKIVLLEAARQFAYTN